MKGFMFRTFMVLTLAFYLPDGLFNIYAVKLADFTEALFYIIPGHEFIGIAVVIGRLPASSILVKPSFAICSAASFMRSV